MPGYHSKKSPSGAKRLHACPGALPFVDSLPEDMRSGSGHAARLGTASHALLETCLSEQKPPSTYEGRLMQITLDKDGEESGCEMLKPRAKLPKDPEARGRTFEVDGDMILNVDRAYDYVERRCEEEGVPMSSLQLETRTNPCPEREDTSGTADVTLDAWPIMLEVIDYKNGRLTVEHEDNPQLLAYLAGRAHDTGWAHDAYQITVIQPNGRHEEGKVRPFPVSKEKLLAFVEKHRAAAELCDRATEDLAALDTNPLAEMPDRVPGTWADVYLHAGEHCDFCDARLVCPAAKAYAKEQAKADFDEEPPNPKEARGRVEALAEALKVLEWAPFLRAHMSAATRFLNDEAKHGRMPPGMKYVRKRGKRVYKPDEEGEPIAPEVLADRMVKEGYISDNERARLFTPSALITGPQAEKLVPSKLRAAFSEEFLHMPPGGLKLVPETDPGEAVVVNVGDDFEDDIEEDY